MEIVLRPFEKEDIETYREWINNPEIGELIDRNLPVSKYEHEIWYHKLIQNRDAVVFAIETIDEHKYIGNVWLWDINWRHHKAEVRIVIGDSDYQGIGLGTDALKLITECAFTELNLNKIYAYVLCYNQRAKKSFEKAGFKIEGILKQERFINGEYHDVLIVAMYRSDYDQ